MRDFKLSMVSGVSFLRDFFCEERKRNGEENQREGMHSVLLLSTFAGSDEWRDNRKEFERD
jgi:hypothetical protein